MAENEASLEDEAALLRERGRKHRQDAETTEAYLDANRSTMSGEAIEEFTGAALLNEAQADECDRLADILQAAAERIARLELTVTSQDGAIRSIAEAAHQEKVQAKAAWSELVPLRIEMGKSAVWYAALRADFCGVTAYPDRLIEWDWIDKHRPAPALLMPKEGDAGV